MTESELIVMAAGIGSRYGGLKQIEPIGPSGEIILDYSIFDAQQAGFGKIIFVINRDIEQVFRERIDRTIGKFCETAYVYQELDAVPVGFEVPHGRQKPWGTAHAVLSCEGLIEGPFAVINADDYYGHTAFQMLGSYLTDAKDISGIYDICMIGYRLVNTLTEHGHVARGVCTVDQEGYLMAIRERTKIKKFNGEVKYSKDGKNWIEIPADSLVSLNLWGFTSAIFSELGKRFSHFLTENRGNLLTAEYFLPDVVNQLLLEEKAAVQVLESDERWYGVTYQEDKTRVKNAIQELIYQGVYPKQLWE
jgi:NDP-sugar pyrophosphorylase family protein